MLNLFKTFIAVVSLCSIATVSFACSAKTETKSTASENALSMRIKSDNPDTLPAPDAETKGFMTADNAANDEASILVGVWNMTYRGPVCMAQAQMVFHPNGNYSGYSQCPDGSYATHLTGTWQLIGRGAIRLQYDRYRDSEGKIIHPQGETFYFRFLDRNRMGLAGGIIAYRSQY